MIKITRLAKPIVLVKNEKAWVKEINESLLNEKKATTKEQKKTAKKKLDNAKNKYQHKDIKKQLKLMFHGRCAYCESKISHIGYGHIEHYRPKEKFPLLAVKWNNLLLSCELCNSVENKGNKFPTSKLIDPCKDDPAQHFVFDYDKNTELANVLGVTNRGQSTELTLNLNRYDLLQHRSGYIKKLIFFASLYHSNQQAREIFDEALTVDSENAEYLAFAKIIKEKYVANI